MFGRRLRRGPTDRQHADSSTEAGSCPAGEPAPTAVRWLRAFWIGIPAAYGLLLLIGWDRVGVEDHDLFLALHSLQYWNARLFGLVKQWTPVLCGGFSLAGDPQVPVLSLPMLLGYLAGPLAGIRLATVVYLAVGWVGGWLYSGLFVEKREGRCLVASLFVGNGFFVCRLSYGHISFLPFLALPLVLWVLHRAVRKEEPILDRRIETGLSILGLAVVLALAVDGSPVAILHLLIWCGIYALALSWVTRRPEPAVLFGAAVVGAIALDAVYLLPMVAAQEGFPRLRPDTFTNPLLALWFMILPIRGRLLPAPTNGHELSVFVGPIVVWLVWKHRRWLRTRVPRELGIPLLVTSIAALWLGMGSLAAIGVPRVLSPFDWLRDLPGFRSMGVTGRYWGFLALPLALLGAAALFRAASQEARGRFRVLAVLLFLFQFSFQLATIAEHLWFAPEHIPVEIEGMYDGGERLHFVESGDRAQALLVTPIRCVVDCYNEHDFVRPPMKLGDDLVVRVERIGAPIAPTGHVTGIFVDWSTIRLHAPALDAGHSRGTWTLTLNQAFHPSWRSGAGVATAGPEGRLVLESVPTDALGRGIELRFHEETSVSGLAISRVGWLGTGALSLLLGAAWIASARSGDGIAHSQ